MNEASIIVGSQIADAQWKIKQNKMLDTLSHIMEPTFNLSSKICPNAPISLLVCIGQDTARNGGAHFM